MAVNMHDAKTHFSRLVERAVAGETVVIARAGHPVAQLTAVDAPVAPRRLGFLVGAATVPDDFNERDADEMIELFEGDHRA
jgi:prevent-host-death family protein